MSWSELFITGYFGIGVYLACLGAWYYRGTRTPLRVMLFAVLMLALAWPFPLNQVLNKRKGGK